MFECDDRVKLVGKLSFFQGAWLSERTPRTLLSSAQVGESCTTLNYRYIHFYSTEFDYTLRVLLVVFTQRVFKFGAAGLKELFCSLVPPQDSLGRGS